MPVLVTEAPTVPCSTPLWSQPILLGPKSRYRVAGAVYDPAYFVGVPRRLADRIWRHVARSGEGVGLVRGFLGWVGLRLGGWVAYRRHARERGRAVPDGVMPE